MNDVSEMIMDTAGRLFADRVDRDLWQACEDGGFSRDAWSAMAEMGLSSMLLKEEDGGTGLAPSAGMALAEMVGYHALPLPLPETFAAMPLLPPAIAVDSDDVVTLAGEHNLDGVGLTRTDDGWTLAGHLRQVPWGRYARYVVLDAAADDGSRQRVIIPGEHLDWSSGVNLAGEARDSAALDKLPALDADAVTALDDAALSTTEWGALLRSLQMAGAMRRALESGVEHANERKQFGRAIARFQAIQQQLAAMAGQVAAAGAAAAAASRGLAGAEPQFLVAIAKARVGEAAGSAAATAHQVHGAMGFTQEHTLHHYTRRLWSWRDEFGAEPYWQARVGARACAAGGDGLWPVLSTL